MKSLTRSQAPLLLLSSRQQHQSLNKLLKCLLSTTAANGNPQPQPNPAPASLPFEPVQLPAQQPDPYTTFYHMDLEVHRASEAQLQTVPLTTENLKFGHHYADHMMESDWSAESGWARPLISPLHNFNIHPGAKVFHYAVGLFEGMKAYRGVDNRIRLFRPEMNMERMKKTAVRSALPDFDAEEAIKLICELVRLDKQWVPYSNTSSLYIRPTLIGTDSTLGVGAPTQARLFVLSGPVGAYYPTGFQPISLLADSTYVRAFPGGVGSFKMGCNYAPTIRIGAMANDMGCQQVLWLFGKDEKLTEVGTMNIFLYWINELGEHELITPPLKDGLILPGVTRDSLLSIARNWGEFQVTERFPTMEEVRRAVAEQRLLQLFGAGTACVVSPVGRILYRNPNTNQYENLLIPTMNSKTNVMQRFYDTIMDIQYGRTDMPEWITYVD